MTNNDGPAASGSKHITPRASGVKLTRRRVPLSCVACRVRKLKCNRQKPCQNCLVRGEANAASCTYAEKVEKKITLNPRSDAEDMRKRLNRLEKSILSMLSSDGEEKVIPAVSMEIDHQTPSVSLNIDQAGGQRISIDTRSTHWDAILNELGAMKDAWSEENDKIEFSNSLQTSTSTKPHRPGLLSGLTQPPDRSTIMSSLPPREEADKLLSRFFDSYNPAIPARYVLHKATFLKQYNQHWGDPSKTKIIWIGLLYSIFCIAMQSYTRANEVPPEYEGTVTVMTELYRVRTAQCITLSDLTRPTEFMIETVDLHSFAEYAEERDGDMGTWILSGIMMRLALQQGFHRDPSQHPSLTVFQGEMRRRIWSAVNQHELLFSVQIGLPKAIRYSESDTQPPRNLYEHELYEGMTELPPSRPLTEDTEISYQCVKYKIMHAYGKVVEFVHIVEPQPYDEVLKLDMLLLQTRDNIPPHLQLGTLEEMRNDSASRVMEKYILQLFYHKALCILHRKNWDSTASDGSKREWRYSRKTCVTSALAMLGHQATMHQASAPGGILGKMKWYHFSITNHDFLLAAILLALDLMCVYQDRKSPEYVACPINEDDKLGTIKMSRAIWEEVVDDCRDARRAVNILTTVLAKLSAKRKESESAVSVVLPAASASATASDVAPLQSGPLFGAPFNLSRCLSLNSKDSPPYDTMMQDTFLNTIGSDLTIPGDFNWDGFDMFLAGQNQPLGTDVTNYPQLNAGNVENIQDDAYLFFNNTNGNLY